MASTFKKLGLAAAVALALSACGGDDGDIVAEAEPGPGDTPSIVDSAKYMIVATDTEGYITFIADDGNGNIARVGESNDEALRATDGDDSNYLSLGEVHFTKDGKYAVIIVSSGFMDGGKPTGGGLLLVDMSIRDIVKQIPLANTKVQDANNEFPVTNPVHSYMDGNTIWINNDGPRRPNRDEPNAAADAVDSVFHVSLDCGDIDSENCGKVLAEIVVGNGHKKGAQNEEYFVTHNLSDQSISVIHKDDHGVKEISLNVNPDPNDPAKMLSNIPHGMDYSELSGKFYTGITNGADMAVAIIDGNSPDLDLTWIEAGPAAEGKIPAAGYVHAIESGKWVLTVGYSAANKMGYLSVIDAATDEVTDVIELGDIQASSFDTHKEDDRTMVVLGASSVGGINNEIKILHLDNATGKAVLDEETGEKEMHSVTVGYGPQHRNGAITLGGERVYYPNACAPADMAEEPAGGHNDAPAHFVTPPRQGNGEAPGTECNTVVTVNLMDHHSDPIAVHKWGEAAPTGIAILQVNNGANAPAGNDNGGNDNGSNTGSDGHSGHSH